MGHHTRLCLCALFLAFLSGCAAVPMATIEQDTKAKTFIPDADRASLYIYRNEIIGAAIPISVSVNGKMLGQTAAQTYFWLRLMPGKYNIESHAENVSSFPISVEAGKTYFVWQELKMGMWMARSLLQQVDEKTGRTGVAESKLILSTTDVLPQGVSTTVLTPAQRLRELESLRKDGLINDEDYQKTRQQLIDKL